MQGPGPKKIVHVSVAPVHLFGGLKAHKSVQNMSNSKRMQLVGDENAYPRLSPFKKKSNTVHMWLGQWVGGGIFGQENP